MPALNKPQQQSTTDTSTRLTQGERTYVLDTSVLLSDPKSIFRFAEHSVVLPVVVIELWQYRRKDLLAPLSLGSWRFACLNAALIAVTVGMWNRFQHGFIYFQF